MGVAADQPPEGAAILARDTILRSYAQILFSRSRIVGGLLIVGTFLVPRAGLYGLVAVVGAFLVTRVFGLSDSLTRTGLFGYNALLVGLGCGVLFGSTVDALVLGAVGIVTAVFMTAALYSALGHHFDLPPLTLPFLFVFYLVLGSARVLGVPLSPLLPEASLISGLLPEQLPHLVEVYLQSLGALFFLPRADVGLAVLVALLVSSRIGVMLSLYGFAVAALVESRLAFVIDGSLPLVLGYNFVLIAIALGGVWFVPSPASLLLAGGGALVCGLAAIGLIPTLTVQALPLLILPFNLAIILILYAMRQRTLDGRPKAVDFAIGSPEDNLAYYRTRIARFGARYTARFRAPFMGKWVCTQGVDGKYTHQGVWRHAFDFEVAGPDGKTFRGEGTRLQDYLCYRLPVLAAADGTVVRAVSDVADNSPGRVDTRDNWGNYVLLAHAGGVYSLVAHLAKNSVKVTLGQVVRQGDVLGLCGASGRSPMPHLHFQLQASPVVGGPTIETELNDVVVDVEDEQRMVGGLVVGEGQAVRNLEPRTDDVGLPPLPNTTLVFDVDGDGGSVRETVISEIDLLGNHVLRSCTVDARAYLGASEDLFRIYDVVGDQRSVLAMLRAAAGSVPLELSAQLRWEDHVPRRPWARSWARWLRDFVSPFVGDTSVPLQFHVERDGARVIVIGRSADGGISTRLELVPMRGIVAVEVDSGGRRRRAQRVFDVDETEDDKAEFDRRKGAKA